MFKKKLALFASFTAITTATPLAVSCGISLELLANRLITDNVFRSIFKFPLTSWSSASTMLVDDNKILADVLGTLVATDKYNRSFGDLTEKKIKHQNMLEFLMLIKVNENIKFHHKQNDLIIKVIFNGKLKLVIWLMLLNLFYFQKTYRQHQDYDKLSLVVHKKFEIIFRQAIIKQIIIMIQFEKNRNDN
ncbi:hypothetical protein [Spiroplasma endosymbiont of Poecilobothrus nobilitatus]|uniref:hypothetical protein n=1 Tax=Spiroplasma endosymbiont of Poecilobothrus nobilitatus TaxID=1209220 RepID=UPI00313DABB9